MPLLYILAIVVIVIILILLGIIAANYKNQDLKRPLSFMVQV